VICPGVIGQIIAAEQSWKASFFLRESRADNTSKKDEEESNF
jgi:hypothetical protein